MLLQELPAHGEIKHEPAQAANGVRRVSHAVVKREQAVSVHRKSASAKICLN